MPNLLIEIGTEELPLGALDVLEQDFAQKAGELLKTYRIGHGKIYSEATPRRICLFVETMQMRQTDQTLDISGPSYEKAYDSNGRPTQALEGFLKSKQASVKDIQIKETPRGKFITIQKKEIGKPSQVLIPQYLKDLINSVTFPKQMRWEKSGFRFPRPIRWLIVLWDQRIIPAELAGVKSKAVSYGHRFLSPKPFKIPKADWKLYEKLLAQHHVILCQKDREKMILKELSKRFAQKVIDEELLRMAAQLVEEPFLIRGRFSKTFLELPSEVLASCMKKNQKIFACYDSKGGLTGHFVAVLNGKRKGLPRIIGDYENVLVSRLTDAGFFYREDTKTPFNAKVEKLDQIVYLGKLGTMLDKVKRLEKLAEAFSTFLGRHDLKEDLKRASLLSKADLITHLVYEFPDLQGIVGKEYALETGEKESVAKAIGTQYLPKNLNESYQELKKEISPLGAILGIIDRLDLLVGAFSIGLEPTGSQDPFALRRAGGSMVKLIRAYGFHFSLREAIEAAEKLLHTTGLRGQGSQLTIQEVIRKLENFFKDRVAFELKIKHGTRQGEIFEAVSRAQFEDIADVFERYEVLARLYEKEPERFLKAAKVVERTSNILKGTKTQISDDIDPGLLQDSLEKELFQVLQSRSQEIENTLARREYEKATLLFGDCFYEPLHRFFEKVLVNAEDAKVRGNRQAIMKKIHKLYAGRLADLSVLSRMDVE